VRKGATLFLRVVAVVALQALLPTDSLAKDGGELGDSPKQVGEDRWVPSLAITSGITIQQQTGFADSDIYKGMSPTSMPLRGFVDGKDTAVSPFVGGTLELMAPALSIPTRPRFFVSGEILPTFASDRDVALEGDPGCIRGPAADDPCASSEDGSRRSPYPESGLNGQGTRTSTEVDTLAFAARLGAAFPVRIGKRQIRIKPFVGWINYEVDAEGLVVDGDCELDSECTDYTPLGGSTVNRFMREIVLSGNDSKRFNGIGPGLEIEMDTGHYGPLGVSLFMGGHAYAIVGDRTISFSSSQTYTDPISDTGVIPPESDRATAQFEAKVDPWIYRAHVGIRFHWLGDEE
jgi:hypothetical protein